MPAGRGRQPRSRPAVGKIDSDPGFLGRSPDIPSLDRMEAPPPCIGAPRIRLRPLRHPRMACKHDEKSRLKMKSKTNRLQELKRPNNVIKVSLPARDRKSTRLNSSH